MAIVKTDFYTQSLNQFAPKRVRGELLDWGLNAWVLDVMIDASETGTLYAGDLVKVCPTSTGKLKVVAGESTDRAVGYIIFNAKKESFKAGDHCSILLRGGVLNCVTEEELDAGAIVAFNDADGSVTGTIGAGVQRMGMTMAATSATEGGTYVPVLVC